MHCPVPPGHKAHVLWAGQGWAGLGSTATLLLSAWPRPALAWGSPREHLAPGSLHILSPRYIPFDSSLFPAQQIIPSSGWSFGPLLSTHLLGCLNRSISATSHPLDAVENQDFRVLSLSPQTHLSSLPPISSCADTRRWKPSGTCMFLSKNVCF